MAEHGCKQADTRLVISPICTIMFNIKCVCHLSLVLPDILMHPHHDNTSNCCPLNLSTKQHYAPLCCAVHASIETQRQMNACNQSHMKFKRLWLTAGRQISLQQFIILIHRKCSASFRDSNLKRFVKLGKIATANVFITCTIKYDFSYDILSAHKILILL